jgi:hypothetical protein
MKHKLFLVIFIVGVFACNSNKPVSVSTEEKEKKSPKSYLSVKGHDRHNLIGQTVIIGDISNSATVVSYKDVDLQLSFFSKTATLLEKDRETIYELIAPGDSKHFKTKYYAPKGTDSVGFEVMGAKVVTK